MGEGSSHGSVGGGGGDSGAVGEGSSHGSVGGGGGDNGLTGGLGKLVLDIGTGDLGDGVAGLNLDRDLDDLGVVNAVLGGDLTASVLHGLGDGVGNGVGNGQRSGNRGDSDSRGSGVGGVVAVGEVLSIGISLSLGLSLPLAVVGNNGSGNGSVTESVNDLSAHLLVLDLLGGDGLGGADLLGGGCADLGDQDHVLGDTSRGRGGMVGDGSHRGGNSVSQRGGVGGVAVVLGLSGRGSASEGQEARQSNFLHHDEIERLLPTMACRAEVIQNGGVENFYRLSSVDPAQA